MLTWEDFHRQFDKVFYQIEMVTVALRKMTEHFKNISETYDEIIERVIEGK